MEKRTRARCAPIEEKKVLDDALKADLDSVLKEFTKGFLAARKSAAA